MTVIHPDPKTRVALTDSPYAPEVYADEACGFFLHNGNVTITFEAVRIDHSANPGPAHRIVIGRLRMPVGGAQHLAAGLYDFLAKSGFDPVPRTAGEKVQ